MPFHLVDHPLAHDALAELRDARTPPPAFRAAAHRISLIVAAEALRDLPTEADTVATPIGPADARIVRADIVIVPVLRAGLGMVESILELVPRARVGHIGLQRDEETAAASRYYSRLPPGLAAQRGAAGRPDAGDRRQRRRGGGHHQGRGRARHPHDVRRGGARGRGRHDGGAPRRAHLFAGARRVS